MPYSLIDLEDLLRQLDTSERGLTTTVASRRLAQVGANEPTPVSRGGPLREFLRFCRNPLVLVLLTAAGTSALLGQLIDASIIAAMILISIVLNFFQAYRSQRAVERLREQVAPTATVLRDGQWGEQSRRDLVPGDIVRLAAGDLVPADARLLASRDLHLQQAALTGESAPVEKFANAGTAPMDLQSPCMVFLGTSVVSGTGTAVVIATGAHTAFGDIAVSLAQRPPETEFDRGTRQFGILIMQTVFFLVLFILLVNLSIHRNPIESLLFAVALAVGLTPEFLPMITTVTLSMGAVRMAREKVIVKHLDAIENFGSIDVLCSDKTGTLTAGAITLDRSLGCFGENSETVLQLAVINSAYETGIRSPLDDAILAKAGYDTGGYTKIDEVPFDFERRRLSIVAVKDDGKLIITKGAPESVLNVCTNYQREAAVRPLDDLSREQCVATYRKLSAEGFRVLAVAHRVPTDREETFDAASEVDLVLDGFLTFSDPPRAGVRESLKALRRDGVLVKILTGDNELVTQHICKQVGIESTKIVLGEQLGPMSDSALAAVVERTDVFARVSPSQKNRIINALKTRGHVVGFLGDGINDAPSLHTADVGISVSGAVDVAKDAADLILLEPGLHVLHKGIVEGRKAFGNLLKYLLMGTSSNFGNMFSMAGASVFLPFLPMLPTQILLNNFLYDLAQVTIPTDNVDPAYIKKPQHWDISIIRNFMIFIGPISSIYDFLTFYVMLRVFHASEELFHTGWFVESLATQTLVLFVIRTAGNPWSNPPSKPLAVTTLGVVLTGVLLPYIPISRDFGFLPLPTVYYLFLASATATYLVLVQLVKGLLIGKLLVPAAPLAQRRLRARSGIAAG